MRTRATLAVAALATVSLGSGLETGAAEKAWVTLGATSRKAQSRPGKEPWTPVATGAALGEGDGLRTLERSSVEARLEGGGRAILTELTTVTLRSARSLSLAAGQLDVDLPAGTAPVEVETAGARVSVLAGETPALARIRIHGEDAQVMAFTGSTRVEKTGVPAIDVAAGSGLTLGKAGAPTPERLLPAPITSVPAPGAAPDHANPRLWWEDVPGASAYTVEVCHDDACAELEDRGVSVVGAPWAPEGLPLGDACWRVVAVSPSGLDGIPSRPVRFTIRSLWRKPHPRPRS